MFSQLACCPSTFPYIPPLFIFATSLQFIFATSLQFLSAQVVSCRTDTHTSAHRMAFHPAQFFASMAPSFNQSLGQTHHAAFEAVPFIPAPITQYTFPFQHPPRPQQYATHHFVPQPSNAFYPHIDPSGISGFPAPAVTLAQPPSTHQSVQWMLRTSNPAYPVFTQPQQILQSQQQQPAVPFPPSPPALPPPITVFTAAPGHQYTHNYDHNYDHPQASANLVMESSSTASNQAIPPPGHFSQCKPAVSSSEIQSTIQSTVQSSHPCRRSRKPPPPPTPPPVPKSSQFVLPPPPPPVPATAVTSINQPPPVPINQQRLTTHDTWDEQTPPPATVFNAFHRKAPAVLAQRSDVTSNRGRSPAPARRRTCIQSRSPSPQPTIRRHKHDRARRHERSRSPIRHRRRRAHRHRNRSDSPQGSPQSPIHLIPNAIHGAPNVQSPTPRRDALLSRSRTPVLLTRTQSKAQADLQQYIAIAASRLDPQLPPISTSFLAYITDILASADITLDSIGTMSLFKYQHPETNEIAPAYISIPIEFPTQPTLRESSASRKRITFVHATTPAGFRGIIQDYRIRPIYWAEQKDSPGFYAFGHLTSPGQTDFEWHHSRVLHKAWLSGKNQADVLIFGAAVGLCSKVTEGGVATAVEQVKLDHVVHEVRTKRWCISTHKARLQGIAFRIDATSQVR